MTELVPAVELPAPIPLPVSAPATRFGAGLASLAFFVHLVVQTLVSVMVTIAAMIVLVIQNDGKVPGTETLLDAALGPAAIAVIIGNGLVAVAVALLISREVRGEAGPRGLGLRKGNVRQHLLTALAGVAVGVTWMLVATLLPKPSQSQYGPLAKIMQTPGTWRYALTFMGIVLAPPAEELFFRGVLLAGYVRRFGLFTGSIITTVLFVLLHVPETLHYLPALGAITIVGIVLLLIRLRTDSIFVSTTFHVTYNAVLMIATLIGGSAFR
jgi:membrane protease YdiL (CAAX protease family)